VLRANLKWKLITRLVGSCLVLVLAIGMTSCERSTASVPNPVEQSVVASTVTATDGPLSEVNTPASIDRLAPSLAKFQPRVSILSPQANQTLDDDRVSVKLQVSDFPLFKSKELGLGNHLHVILDKQTYQGVYDLTQPLVFENLAPGTHTLRVFASRPWHESFKNPGAYAQTTFHVLTKTTENNPDPSKPLLTYSRPAGKYGAEPIMLDYYLTNAPTHVATTDSTATIPDWQIRVTINNQQFTIDRWAPIYLQGFKPGKNLVKLELLDDRGNPISNVYNESIGAFDYDPTNTDSLAKLVQGRLSDELARTLVDPNYASAKTPVPATKEVAPTPAPLPPVASPLPSPSVAPSITPSPVTLAPSPQPTPLPSITPALPQRPIAVPSPVTPPPQSPQPGYVPPAPVLTLPSPSPVTLSPQPSSLPVLPAPQPSPVTVIPPQPLATPSPIVIAPPQPLAQPAPSPIVIPTPVPQQPQPLPSPIPLPSPVVVAPPAIAPSPTPSVPQPQQPSAIPSPVVVLPQQPLPLPIPVTIVPPQPKSLPIQTPSPNPVPPAITTPIAPAPAPAPTPTPQQIVVVPPAPTIVVPVPATPSQPIATPPQQIPIPTPIVTPQPTVTLPQPSATIDPPESTIPVVEPDRDRWQTKAREVLTFLGVKIRAFTNTIPAKAQRFGHNVQIWTGQAIEWGSEVIRSWRDKQAG
jgi:hypothetical protein